MNTMAAGYWQAPPYFVPKDDVRTPRRVWAPLLRSRIRGGKTGSLLELAAELLITSTAAGVVCEVKPDAAVRVGLLIAQIQAAGHLTRAQIGELVGVDRRSLSGWCRGETLPQAGHQVRLETVAEFVQRLAALDIGSVSEAIFASESLAAIKAAIGEHDLGRAERAVLGTGRPEPEATVMEVSPEVWDQIVHLTKEGARQVPLGLPVADDSEVPSDEESCPPVRVHLDRSQLVGGNTMSLRNHPVV